MLKKQFRGMKKDQISGLFQNPEVRTESNAAFRVFWKEGTDSFQCAVLLPSKLFSTAVQRNRMKRRLYSYVRQEYCAWTASGQLAILVKKDVLRLSREQQLSALKKLLGRIFS